MYNLVIPSLDLTVSSCHSCLCSQLLSSSLPNDIFQLSVDIAADYYLPYLFHTQSGFPSIRGYVLSFRLILILSCPRFLFGVSWQLLFLSDSTFCLLPLCANAAPSLLCFRRQLKSCTVLMATRSLPILSVFHAWGWQPGAVHQRPQIMETHRQATPGHLWKQFLGEIRADCWNITLWGGSELQIAYLHSFCWPVSSHGKGWVLSFLDNRRVKLYKLENYKSCGLTTVTLGYLRATTIWLLQLWLVQSTQTV